MKNKFKKLSPTLGVLIIIILALAVRFFTPESEAPEANNDKVVTKELSFRSDDQLADHYEKHGIEMGFDSADAYLEAANDVIADEDALHKTEAEDGDDVYYLEETNEFVIVSKDGYIRTYFYPSDGLDYYNRQ